MELLYQLSYIGLYTITLFQASPSETMNVQSALAGTFLAKCDKKILIHFPYMFNVQEEFIPTK